MKKIILITSAFLLLTSCQSGPEKFKTNFSEDTIKDNFSDLKSKFSETFGDTGNIKDKLNKDTVNDLMSKVGLSEETAQKVNEAKIESF